MRRPTPALVILLLLTIACATSQLGKSIQTADLQKRMVEEAAVEFIKLQLKGDQRITPAIYDEARRAYQLWSASELALAKNLATWKTVKSPQNEESLTNSLATNKSAADGYLSRVAPFVNLESVRKKVEPLW